MSQSPRHLLFDLDGTLVDSAPVIVAILNDMLWERGSSRRMNVRKIRPWLSWGGPALIAAVLKVEGDAVTTELAEFRKRYAARKTPAECVFADVREGVGELAALGFSLAICSNKPQYLCEKVLDDVGIARHFSAVIGSRPELKQKPAPDLVQLALEEVGAEASQAFMIGDSDVDHAAAEAAGVAFRLLDHGYAPEDWDTSGLVRFATFIELVDALKLEQPPIPPLHKAA